jgi:hypothetical protein
MGMATNVTVSASIIRAWFDMVLNPMIQALTTEATVLAKGNLTWKVEEAPGIAVARKKSSCG